MSFKTIEKNIKHNPKTGKYKVNFRFKSVEVGKEVRSSKTFDDLKQARIALKEHTLAVCKDVAIAPNKITFNESIKHHLDLLSLKSEETTLYGYGVISKHIAGHSIGKKLIQDIKPADIQSYLTYIQSDKMLSSNTALKHYNFINSVLSLLCKQEVLFRNPAVSDKISVPKKITEEADYLTPEETDTILGRIKGSRIELAFAIGIYTAMRRGEICGLRWENVDFENNVIYINNNRTSAGSKVLVKKPKTKTSLRPVSMTAELKAHLHEEIIKQESNKAILKSAYVDEGYVVCDVDGKALRPNRLSEWFKHWFELDGNRDLHRITPHGLRHSFVAYAIKAGVDIYVISRMLGHASVTTTSNKYAHLLKEVHVEAMEITADVIRNTRTAK